MANQDSPDRPLRVTVLGAGISGLAYAYYLTKAAQERGVPLRLRVLEAASEPGGRVRTARERGYLVEYGANGVLGSKPAAVALAYELGLGSELIRARPVARWRYIFHEGRLKPLPLGLRDFLKTDLLSSRAKWRLCREPFISRWSSEQDPDLRTWAARRFGAETTDVLIDAMCAGIYAVGPEHLSARSAFAQLWHWEQHYGSVLRGALAAWRRGQPSQPWERALPPEFPRRGLWSFHSGMGRLTSALAQRLGKSLQTGVRATVIGRRGSQWVVATDTGMAYESDYLVLALDARTQARLLTGVDQAAARLLEEIEFVPLVVVAVGFQAEGFEHPLNGFGYLVPSRYRRGVLGVLWSSSVFPNRAPKGHVLLRVIAGGLEHPELVQAQEHELLRWVREELARTMGVQAAPCYQKIIRWEKAIPIPAPGHARRVAAIRDRLRRYGGLVSLGNFYDGVSVNDCVIQAYKAAHHTLEAWKRSGAGDGQRDSNQR